VARNPVLEAIRSRRSVRRFTDQAVSRADVAAILEAGRWAPSGLNNQPWRFLVLRPGDGRAERLAGCTKYRHVVQRARALIVLLLEREAMYSEIKDRQAAGACMQNMLLAAHGLGLGGVWLGEIINQEFQALEALGLPAQRFELAAVLALGHPAAKGRSSRKRLSELVLEEF